MIRFISALTALVFAGPALGASANGVYDVDPRLCAISNQSTTRLIISAGALSVYETDCAIRKASGSSLTLACNDGDQVWIEKAHLVGVDGGLTLSGVGQDRVYRRCR